MAKILMLVGDFVEDYEAMAPFQALQIAGHDDALTIAHSYAVSSSMSRCFLLAVRHALIDGYFRLVK
jgi:putative intracellular protease/amidase